MQVNANPNPAPETGEQKKNPLGDTRFRALLSTRDWYALSPEVRARFSKRVANGHTVIYAGEVVEAHFSRFGWWFARAARLIGGPLPLYTETGVPAIVTVTEDRACGGQIWTRVYARTKGFPQTIHTSKRFRGDTGLEEYLGCGFGMALAVKVEPESGAIVFASAGYFLEALGRKWKWPALLSPGALTVTHAEAGTGRFSFTLTIEHPRFGVIIRQKAVFREVA
jgi:uncharacterized protein DUF4166